MCVQHGLTGLQSGKNIGIVNHAVGEVGIWIDAIPNLGERTENHSSIDSLRSELVADKQESQQEQESIDTHHQIRERIGITTDDRIDNDTESGDRTDDQVRGHQEIIDRCSTYTHAECHDDKFAPELLRAQRVHEGLPLLQPVLFGKVFVHGYIRCFAL